MMMIFGNFQQTKGKLKSPVQFDVLFMLKKHKGKKVGCFKAANQVVRLTKCRSK